MISAVLDTNVIVSATLTHRGAAAAILEAGLRGDFHLIVSPPLLLEYELVLMRPKFGHEPDHVIRLINAIRDVADVVSPLESLAISPDPDDNRLLECSVMAKAHCLVTGNKKHFPEQWESTRIVSPREFLDALGSRKPQTP